MLLHREIQSWQFGSTKSIKWHWVFCYLCDSPHSSLSSLLFYVTKHFEVPISLKEMPPIKFYLILDVFSSFKSFSETLEMADDMAIDIPHIWLYLAELVTPMLKEGGISMRELIQ